MVRRVAEALAPLATELVVSVADARMAESLGRILPGAVYAIDQRHRRGPIEGFLRGFEASHGERMLVAPCDAPLLRPALYKLLLETIGDHEAAVPRLDVLDPVRAVYRRTAALLALNSTGPAIRSPSSLVDHLDSVFRDETQVRAVDPRLDSFLDVNREDDLVEVRARLRSA